MRVRRLALAAALPLALALAACSGGAAAPEVASTPAPTAAATTEATLMPAPTASPTPEAASTLEQACANGVAVAEPEAHPGLVADCEALLRAKDALRGDASLDWGGGLAVADWEGIAVSGEPPRVTGLDLRGKGLTGSIPRELRRLRLGEVRLAGNALTGCVPSAFEDASGDAASLGLPWCLRYDRLDAAGEVASSGEWAILGGNGAVLTTWEQLRSEAAALRVHQIDAGGASWASEFGAVAVNDLFEWRLADDCWVRYRVTDAPVAPSGASGRWEFPVEWMTYAATGAGCTGEVGASAVLRVDEAPLPVTSHAIPAPSFVAATPVRHGPYLMYPAWWRSALEVPLPVSAQGSAQNQAVSMYTTDIAEARSHPLWRHDPAVPSEWRLEYMTAPGLEGSSGGFLAVYATAGGYTGAYIYVSRHDHIPIHDAFYRGGNTYELQMIDGHPAILQYSRTETRVRIFDEATRIEYFVIGTHSSLRSDIDATTEIARSLYGP